MPRIGKVQPCIFCGKAPCECNKPPAAAPVARKKLEPKAKDRQPVDLVDDRNESADPFGDLAPIDNRSRFKKVEEEPEELSQDERELQQALRNLAAGGLLSSSDVAQYKHLVDPSPPADLDRRVHEWRGRNGQG